MGSKPTHICSYTFGKFILKPHVTFANFSNWPWSCPPISSLKKFWEASGLYRLVNETRMILLVQAGMQTNQFASMIDCTGNIIHFTEDCATKSFFFSQDSKETCSLIFVSIIRKVKLWITQKIIVLLFICKICVILYCKVLNVFNFKLFNPPISFSKLELLLIHG